VANDSNGFLLRPVAASSVLIRSGTPVGRSKNGLPRFLLDSSVLQTATTNPAGTNLPFCRGTKRQRRCAGSARLGR
jgi:hypothetical protein